MNLKKILIPIFVVVVLIQLTTGIYLIFDAFDIVENGQLIKFKCNIPSVHRKAKQLNIYTYNITTDYTKDIPQINDAIKKESNLNRLGFHLNVRVNVAFTTDEHGFAKVKDYYVSTKKSPTEYSIKELWLERGIRKNSQTIYHKIPKLNISAPKCKLSFSEQAMEKIEKYLKTVEKKHRGKNISAYVVYRIKGDKVIPIDCVVDGKSLTKIAKQ